MASLVVKLGSSIVVDDRGEPRLEVLRVVCAQLAELYKAGHDPVLVTSGAIARGMGVRGAPLRPRAIDELQAASAVGQGKLYRTYDELLTGMGIPSAQVLLTFFDMSARTHYLNARRTLRKLLDWRIVPVINENDTTTTDEISFGDNDFLAAQVAVLVDARLLLMLTSTAGLFTADPRVDRSARLVSSVDSPGELEGPFEAGDAVEVRAAASDLVGKGISNYSAAELRRVMGLKSAEVREVLPRATDEAVHRDYFVLT